MKQFLLVSLIVNAVLVAALGIFGFLFWQKKIIIAPVAVKVVKNTVATVNANKSWDLPATTSAKVSQLTLTITTIEKTDKITSGKTQFTTKNHKAFLVVNTVVANNGVSSVSVAPSAFVQLQINNGLTDAVYKALVTTLAPGKTYDSSMVFLVNESDTSFVLSIGKNVGKTNLLNISL